MAYQHPYLTPKLPFTGCIQGRLFEGKTVTLTGRVMPGATRFHVNLQCGIQASADIAFHFNPRYSNRSDLVVCNTRQDSTFGAEERRYESALPRGSDFTLTFLVNRDSYSVIVNGAHFLEYQHRLPFSRVDAISVDGGVDVQSISFQNPATLQSVHPSVSFINHSMPSGRGRRSQKNWHHLMTAAAAAAAAAAPVLGAAPPAYSPQQAYVMPYKTIIQGGLCPGKVITVQGFVNHDADRFSINLRYNSGIAFHFNPRFNENVVVRNSLIKERWGAEERAGGMPFYRGQSFMVTIICDTQWYKVMINDVQMFTYNHRHFLLQQIDILDIEGNVSLNAVTV